MDILKFTGLDTNRNKILLNKNDKLKETVNNQTKQILSLEFDLNNLDIKYERLKLENKTLVNECEKLENKNNQIFDDFQKLEEMNFNLVNENKLLVTDLKNYQIKTTDFKKKIDVYNLNQTKEINKISSIKDKHLEETKKLNKKNNILKLELNKITESFQILENDNVMFQEKITNLENESVNNLKSIKKLQTRIKTLETQKTRLNNKNHKLLEQTQKQNFNVIENLKEENNNNQIYLKELISTIGELISKNKK